MRRITRRSLLRMVPGAVVLLLGACAPGAATQPAPPAATAAEDPAAAVEPGQGAVLSIGGKKVAVFRDEAGNVTRLSPRCPHQGCEVSWNANDRVWECPCHGSRFSPRGELLGGPASKGLDPAS